VFLQSSSAACRFQVSLKEHRYELDWVDRDADLRYGVHLA